MNVISNLIFTRFREFSRERICYYFKKEIYKFLFQKKTLHSNMPKMLELRKITFLNNLPDSTSRKGSVYTI